MKTKSKLREKITEIIGMKVNLVGREDLNIPARSYYSADEKQVNALLKAFSEELESLLKNSNYKSNVPNEDLESAIKEMKERVKNG